MRIPEIQQQIVEEFSYFEDWQEKYEYLIEMGKNLPPLLEELKTEDKEVKGCQSKVWLLAECKGDILWLRADSDGILTKGMVALLLRVFSGQKVDEIMQADTSFIEQIGLHEFLSPNRANGLLAMIKKIKYSAMLEKAKSTSISR